MVSMDLAAVELNVVGLAIGIALPDLGNSAGTALRMLHPRPGGESGRSLWQEGAGWLREDLQLTGEHRLAIMVNPAVVEFDSVVLLAGLIHIYLDDDSSPTL